ncbi:type II toxin-antitoxin system HicA family toxin [Candidatus Babela massiliensis]|uniref:Toxin-antitoxin system component HicA, mRNA interferase toxin n=1 Tax=Candidatus Babela massiliensis TaxID=673862 RepID=V6DGY9_9BACT|nr:type II toxin-antitoxin system HicA family toxin [Candidatus Babela massiliensis]CDK30814.1 Toxin-antitoxin system component HicA, mRNA interferase toxin [Candidatus Babela massiliensis]
MSILEKLISKVFSDSPISYNEAEKLLITLGFSLRIKGSHHIFIKPHYLRAVSIKKRKELLAYQIKDLRQVLLDHGYEK